jgi:uncharacterized lipoprotein YddW (UPF0748 family)
MVMRKIRISVLLILFVVMIGLFAPRYVFANGDLIPLVRGTTAIYHYNTSDPVMIPATYTEQESEFRGVWVATVFNLNFPLHTSETQYKDAFMNLINQVKSNKMNAILFQVRPNNDAFHDSALAPYSRWLTGTEGGDPGWDVLGWMIETSHANGIEFHAWMNPYRVANSGLTKTQMINGLHPDNFARLNPDLVIAGNISNNLYPYILNPGEPAVKAYIRDVVKELIDLYDVDGIHFDDYFYPYSGLNSDGATYDTYKLPDQSLADWRRENVNEVIRGVKEDIDAHNSLHEKDVRFGVSPFGIWRSGGEGSNTSTSALQSYSAQFADSRKWVQEGWVHYIAPQVYWRFNHSLAPYADVVDWWAQTTRGTGVDLVIGQAIYSAHLDNWPDDEITTQIIYNQKHPEIKGSIMYSASYLHRNAMTHVNSNVWTETPLSTWQSSNVATPSFVIDGIKDGNVYRSNVTVSLTGEATLYVRLGDGEWQPYTDPILFDQNGSYVLYAKTINAENEQSLINSINVVIEKVNNDVPTIRVEGEMIGDSYVVGAQVFIDADNDILVAINYGSVGAFNPYTEPITLTGTGNYFIRAKTVNDEGVESQERTLLIKVTEPCYPNPTIQITGAGNHPYYQDAVITLQSETSIQYRINGGIWQDYTDPFILDQEGSYLIEYRNKDACQVMLSENVVVDRTVPNEPLIDISGAFDGWFYTEQVEITLSSLDANDTIYYRIHNGTSWSGWKIVDETIHLIINATYTIEYYAVDKALNHTETYEARIRLNIPPSEDNLYVIRNGKIVNYYNTSNPVLLPTSYTEKTNEVRAVWVATVHNIDIGLHTSEAAYKGMLLVMLDRIKANNFNVMFFQVRPMNDAFYPSSHAPFSRYLTGTEGVDPGWDVLAFVIEEAHKRGIEVHAWLNPYRVSNITTPKDEQLAALHDDNYAKQNPDFVLVDNNGRLILNPGEHQVRMYLRNVIDELITNYAIDGIHFDDYFYSYGGMNDIQDAQLYEATKLTGQSLADWRRMNVDLLVQDVFNTIDTYNQMHQKNVKFGISPFGIWKSGGIDGSNTSTVTLQSYHHQYADSKKWVEEGWVHYIMPQLYWEFSHHLAPFADLVDWWADLTEKNNVDLIIGHGFYRYADNSWTDPNEITEQLRYISQYESIKGSAFFSYKTLNSPHSFVTQALDRILTHYWTVQSGFPWETDLVVPIEPVCETGYEVIDGECVLIPITCEEGYQLIDGQCVLIPITCEEGYQLIDGECVLIPITCEEGYQLIDGECVLIPETPKPQKTGCFGLWTAEPKPTIGAYIITFMSFMTLMGIAIIKRRI